MKRLLSFSFFISISLLLLSSCALTPPAVAPLPSATLISAASPTPPPPDTATPTLAPGPTASPMPPPATPVLLPGPPNPQGYALAPVFGGLTKPVALTYANDGSGRLFVVEQPGTIRVIKNGVLLSTPFLDLQNLVNASGNERGLLGLAFSPNYAADGEFFVNYTDGNGNTMVARYHVSAEPDRADPNSAQTVLQAAQPYPNHNGGDLAFGPDGYLYIGLGDGGSGGDPQGNGQNLQALLGKMLRIDVRAAPYAVPPDNPFVNRGDARPEVWAYGLRNPWRYSFDRATGDLYLADVGQNEYEEINFQPAGLGGQNYGWNFMEGQHAYAGGAPEGLTAPVFEYSHTGGHCSVTGGYVYRGAALPELNGVYWFADYCSGQLWTLFHTPDGWDSRPMFGARFNVSSFGEDAAGEIYLLDHWGGAVYQLVAAP